MRRPDFWYPTDNRGPWQASLLWPASLIWRALSAARRMGAQHWSAPVPVICIGNAVAGGSGKTPVVAALAERFSSAGFNVHTVSYGYGGSLKGPLRVAPGRHDHRLVGDEALLLAGTAPSWIGRDRVQAIKQACDNGADIILVDDGMQNPNFNKDLSLLVVDGESGFGNGCVIPAGPLREDVDAAFARAGAVIIMGEGRAADEINKLARRAQKPVIRARLAPTLDAPDIRGKKVFAFAGIGRPEKFASLLTQLGATVTGLRSFADHHVYGEADVAELIALSRRSDAALITTEKDAIRLPPTLKSACLILPVRALFESSEMIDALIRKYMEGATRAKD